MTETETHTTNGLAGVRIAITRSEHQADAQRQLLEAQGAEVFFYPAIDILPPRNVAPLDNALRTAADGGFDWLIFTSTNTVDMVADRLEALGLSLQGVDGLKFAAVGSSSAEAIRAQLGVDVDQVPEKYTGDDLADALGEQPDARILLPQSALAKETLAETLRAGGADVTVVEAYRNVVAIGGDEVPAMLWEGSIDAITFTSASTVRFFAKRLQLERGTLAMLDHVVVACIGPMTAAAARQFGLDVAVVPEEHTLAGLTQALVAYFHDDEAADG